MANAQPLGELAALPVQQLALVLSAVDTALQDEGVPLDVINRVRNRVVWGHPEGGNAVVRLSDDDIARIRADVGGQQCQSQ